MKADDLEAMHAVETNHWWFVGKRMLFERLLFDRLRIRNPQILDVGCGTGGSAWTFATYGHVYGCDRSLVALRLAQRSGLRDLVAADAEVLPFDSERFDIVLAFDIVEHVDDDRAMLAELGRVVRPGGAIAIHVPAWPALWSGHDEVLGHRRRYTRATLREAITAAGLRIEYLGWASTTILPAAAAARVLRPLLPSRGDRADLYPLPRPLNR
ncbi:MAG: class I SAM-dependent methyltransferase, partial [Deltaproteobacteria bacterium]